MQAVVDAPAEAQQEVARSTAEASNILIGLADQTLAGSPSIGELDDAYLGLNHQDVQNSDMTVQDEGVDGDQVPTRSATPARQQVDQLGDPEC